jgi:hypothetical protein
MLFLAPVLLIVTYGFLVVVCLFLQSCFKRIPPEYRQVAPRRVWLLLIPCFSILWVFVVCIKLARSFKSYFGAQGVIGVMDVGDCGYALSLAYCITTCVAAFLMCAFPFFGFVPLATEILQAANGGGDAPALHATFVLMIVDLVNPIPAGMFVFSLAAPSGGSLLPPTVIFVLLVFTLVKFIMLRNRIGKFGSHLPV